MAAACQGEISLDENINDPANNPNNDNNVKVIENNGSVLIGDKVIDPARVTIHRLNRAEYNNTVRDLQGDITKPADIFPDDDFGYGFNNIADVLSLSPVHLEFYNDTAKTLVDTALGDSASTEEMSERFEAETLTGSAGAQTADGWDFCTQTVLSARPMIFRLMANTRLWVVLFKIKAVLITPRR